jgi:hypothetical protein
MTLRFILAAAATVSVCGCAHPVDRADAPAFGASLKAMMAAQAEPTAPTTQAPEASGAAGARAVDAMNNGAPPSPPPTINMNVTTTNSAH